MRTTNNLLERLHASFFFYVLTNSDRFVKIGNFLPSAILISVAMMFGGLHVWVDAAWVWTNASKGEVEENEKKSVENKRPEPQPTTSPHTAMGWVRRRRSVLDVLFMMIGTHIFGASTFFVLSSQWYNTVSVSF